MDEKELAALKESNPKAYESYMAVIAERDKLKTKPQKKDPPADPDDDEDDEDDEDEEDSKSLAGKARKTREDKENKAKYEQSLGAALKFNMGTAEFLKANAGLVPDNVKGIFEASEKEKYDSEIQKSNAIKVGLVSEFFAVQENMDLLTGSQKVEIDNFLKLTKNGKEDRVESLYAMIFEPTLESKRRIEKAKQLNNGVKNQTDVEKQLADKMMKASKAHYLGVKA